MNFYPLPFKEPYLILPADNLVSSLITDVYVKGDCFDEKGFDNGKTLECSKYYRTCEKHSIELKNNA